MEHHETDVSRWVDERLSSLEPAGDWLPHSGAAFAKLERRTAPRRRWWLWVALSAAAAAACAALLLVSMPTACANPLGCSPSAKATGATVRTESAVPARTEFKQSGSPAAPVDCELYSDYACPHCAAFYLETLPQLSARYVDTGKVRLVHRDFPLPQHRYARLAALYADAAGEAGYYQAVADKLYRTQAVWSADGDVDAQVAKVVPSPAMEKVRSRVHADPSLDTLVTADETAARENRIVRTPTLRCNGQVIGPNLSFTQIEAQIDPLVGSR